MKKALVFGASGLVGSYVVRELLHRNDYSEVICFVRKHASIEHPKYKEVITDFSVLEDIREKCIGDEVYLCIGTTIKKAGSVANMEEIDRHMPAKIAQLCINNTIKSVALVSSIGANSGSGNYYLRIKGCLEDDLKSFNPEKLIIVRPSIIIGKRKEKRFGELVGKVFISLLGFLLFGKLKKYKGIHAQTIARALIRKMSESGIRGVQVFESDKLQQIGK